MDGMSSFVQKLLTEKAELKARIKELEAGCVHRPKCPVCVAISNNRRMAASLGYKVKHEGEM